MPSANGTSPRPLTSLHRELAERLLGAVIARPSLLGLNDSVARVSPAHLPTPVLQMAWLAVEKRMTAGNLPDGPLGVSELLPYCGEEVTGDFLHTCLANGGFPREIELAGDTAQEVIEAARAADRARQLRDAAACLESGEPLAVVDERVLSNATLEYGQEIDHDFVGAVDAVFDNPAEIGASTGIAWLDDVTGGMLLHELWLLGGRYKGGKTRTQRHITLARLLRGDKCSHFALEGTYTPYALDMVAMLATKYLIASNRPELASLSGRLFRRLGNLWQQRLNPIQVDAIQRARKVLGDWKEKGLFRIYTAEHNHGGVHTIQDVRRYLRLDTRQGVQFASYDYAQRFTSEGKLFDAMREVALVSQDITQELPVSLLGLVQLNEARNNEVEGDFSLGAGIKGGGDLPSSADVFLTVSNDIESYNAAKTANKPDALMKLTLFFSRFDAADETVVKVNRTSGLILGEVDKGLKREIDV